MLSQKAHLPYGENLHTSICAHMLLGALLHVRFCVCVSVCVRAFLCVHTFLCVRFCMGTFCVCTSAWARFCMCVSVCVLCVCTYACARFCVCTFACVLLCVLTTESISQAQRLSGCCGILVLPWFLKCTVPSFALITFPPQIYLSSIGIGATLKPTPSLDPSSLCPLLSFPGHMAVTYLHDT